MSPLRRLALLPRDLAGALVWGPGPALMARAPRSWLRPAAAAGGDLRRWMSRDREELREELRLLFGHRPLPRPEDQILAEAFKHSTYNDLEVLRFPSLRPANLDQTAIIEGREHLDAALARGRGAIVLIGHFGNNLMIMPALGHLGYPMNQLSAPPTVWADLLRETRTTPLYERTLARRWALEQTLPVRHINVFSFLRPAFAALKDNQVLGLAFDGGGGAGWCSVRLMARRANISIQPIQLWRKSGAALIPGVVVREPGSDRHRVILEPELDWTKLERRSGDKAADKAAEDALNLQRFVDGFSRWVERYPEHYLYYLLLRRRTRGSDVRPLFDDYPPDPNALPPGEAERRLREAGERSLRRAERA